MRVENKAFHLLNTRQLLYRSYEMHAFVRTQMQAAAQSLAAKSNEKTGPKFLWPNKSEVSEGSKEKSPPWQAFNKQSLHIQNTATYI